MADRIEYQKKLKDLQKYVPFLENTINKLTREPGKPRQQQISKLQSLLEILTDTSRKLKLDALGKCEEVILKLQAQVEKNSTHNMHKFMCRTPPEPSQKFDENEDRLFDARNKLKQIDLVTPCSPSPTLEEPKILNKPVVIPTEKINPQLFDNSVNKNTISPWEKNYLEPQRIPTLVNNDRIIKKIPNWMQHRQWHDEPGKNYRNEPLYQRRSDLNQHNNINCHSNMIWNRGAFDNRNYCNEYSRDIVSYEDVSRVPSPASSVYEPKPRNNIPIIPTETPKPVPSPIILPKIDRLPGTESISDLSLSEIDSPKKTFIKPPLSASDLQSLLSPVVSSTSSSPSINEDMEMDKLESLRESLKKEIEKVEHKSPKPIPAAVKNSTPIPSSAYAAKPKTPKVIERVIKEPDNIFGNLLSSIDEQIMVKQKKEGVKVDPKKKDIKVNLKSKSENKPDINKDRLKISERKSSSSSEKDDKLKKKSESKTKESKPKEDTKKSSESKSSDVKSHDKSTDEIKVKNDKSKLKPKSDESKTKSDDSKHKSDKSKSDDKGKSSESKHKSKTEDSKSKVKRDDSKSHNKTEESRSKSKTETKSKDKTDEAKSKLQEHKTHVSKDKDKSETKVKTDESKTKVTEHTSKDKNKTNAKDKTDESKSKITEHSSKDKNKTNTINKTDESKSKTTDHSSKDKDKIDTKDITDETKSKVIKTNTSKDKDKSETKDKTIDSKSKIIDDKRFESKKVDTIDSKQKIDTKSNSKPNVSENKVVDSKNIENASNNTKKQETKLPEKKIFEPVDVLQAIKNVTSKIQNKSEILDAKIKVTKKFEPEKPSVPIIKDKDTLFPKLKFDKLDNEDSSSTFSMKSDSSTDDNQKPKQNTETKYGNTGRLSDKYPHKRKISTETREIQPINQFNLNSYHTNDPRTRNQPQFLKPVFPDQPAQQRLAKPSLLGHPDNFRPGLNDPRTANDTFSNCPPNDRNFQPNDFQNRNFPNRNIPMRNEDMNYNFQNNQCRQNDPRINNKNDVWIKTFAPNRQFENQNNFEPFRGPEQNQNQQNANEYDLTKIGPIEFFDNYKQPLLETPILSKPIVTENKNFPSNEISNRFATNSRWNKDASRGRGGFRDRYDNHSRGRENYSRGKFDRFNREYSRDRSNDSHRTYGEYKNSRKNSYDEERPRYNKFSDKSSNNDEDSDSKKSILSFKIPKIKRPVEEEKPENIEQTEKINEENVETETKSDIKDDVVIKNDVKTTDNEEKSVKTEVSEASTQPSKTEIVTEKNEQKTEESKDLITELVQKILQQGDSSVFINLLETLKEAIPTLKSKKTPRIIESDSEEETTSTVEQKPTETKEEEEKPTETQENMDKAENTESVPDKVDQNVVESVGERIKNRRRTPQAKSESPEIKKPQKIRSKKRSSLEMLQDDIREMFICEGVLTASERQRMCRIIREQNEALEKAQESPKKKEEKTTPETITEDTSTKKGRGKPKKKDTIQKNEQLRVTRSSPRVVLEKTDMSKYHMKNETVSSEDETRPETPSKVKGNELNTDQSPEVFDKPKRCVRRTRASLKNNSEVKKTIQKDDMESEEDETLTKKIDSDDENLASLSIAEDTQKKRSKTIKKNVREPIMDVDSDDNTSLASLVTENQKPKSTKTVYEDDSDFDSESITSSSFSDRTDISNRVSKGKIIKKKKRSNWAMGVIKNSKRKAAKNKTDQAEKLEYDDASDEDISPDREAVKKLENILVNLDEDQIDLKPDKNYYLDNKKTEKQCKICSFKGRFIVHHYRSQHPDSENMISRLSPKVAQAAIDESENLNFKDIEAFDEQYKFRKDRFSFSCRFCSVTFKNERASFFYDHISVHTGEYRHACEHCPFKAAQRKSVNTHYSTTHNNIKRRTVFKPLWDNPPDFRIVFGYICKICNFTQLEKCNVEKHMKEYHADENGEIVKINMSAKRVPLPEKNVDDTVKEVPKMPDLKVFMTSESIDNEEKRSEEEKLKKMQEVAEKIKNPKRSELSIINKLHDKLNTVRDETNSSPIEDFIDVEEIDTLNQEPEKVSEIKEITELPIEKTVSIPEILPENTAQKSDELVKEPTLTKLSSLITSNKRKPVTSTIQRLTAKLNNPIELPKFSEVPSKTDDVPLVLDIGVIKATVYNQTNIKFECLVEGCTHKTAWTIESEFKNHCINAHRISYGVCKICGGLPLDIIGNYYHLREIHCSNSIIEQFLEQRKQFFLEQERHTPVETENTEIEKTVENVNAEAVPPLIKLRKLPGDLLSNSPPYQNKTVETETESKPVETETESDNDLGFSFQISDVKTLTLEEEEKLYKADNTTEDLSKVTEINDKDVELMSAMEKKLFLYNCPKCNFLTNEKKVFADHMKVKHENILLQFFNCIYCGDIVMAKDLATHIDTKHGYCAFLCAYCPYRACLSCYIEIHEQKEHFQKKILILRLDNFTISMNNQNDSFYLSKKAVPPYICRIGKCRKNFLLAEDFKEHFQITSGHRNFSCFLCDPYQIFKTFENLEKHLLTHNIGKYQCHNCLFGAQFPEDMLSHYAKTHPNQYPNVTLRSVRTSNSTKVDLSGLEIVDLTYLYLDSIHQAKPYSEIVKNKNTDVENVCQNASEEIETVNLLDDDGILQEKQLMMFSEPMITVKHKDPNAIANAIDPLSIDPLENNENNEIEVNEPIKETEGNKDVSNFELFRCGTKDCTFSTDTVQKFKDHLFSCNDLQDGGFYTCIHCTKKFNRISSLTEHIQVHGTLRYVCSMCDHKAAFEHMITKHMKIKHKIHSSKLVPTGELFIAVPNYNSILKKQAKPGEEKFIFEPEELEDLPRMAIYSLERKCAKCGYASKVRTNIYRHLQAHLNDAPVAETAPVNPVPCLEKNEKMFDKMLNLANSSFSTSRMGAKEKTTEKESNIPCFVPASKRFVCGAEGCNYLTHNDSMLKYHFNALHSDETTYKCPHCKIELINEFGEVNIEDIVFHLRMHDLHLYKCTLCDYIHYQKHKVKKHLEDKHPNKVPYIQVIRELDNSANLEGDQRNEIQPIKETKDERQFKCAYCRHRSQNETDIKTHVLEAHGIESQFKCSLCSFKCNIMQDFTTHAKSHPVKNVILLPSYYRCDSVADKNTVTNTETDSFDTTPLWRRDKDRVKNIRGILIEEIHKSPKKTPKSQEKNVKVDSKNTESVTKKLFVENEPKKEEVDSKENDMIKTIGDFGSPVDNKYSCPFCKEYQSFFKRKFVHHICKELNYNKYKCGNCVFEAPDYNTVLNHYKEIHSQESKPNIKPLTPDARIEKWIDKVLQVQSKEIQRLKEELPEEKPNIEAPNLVTDIPKSELKEEIDDNKDDIVPLEGLLVASSSSPVKLLSPAKVHKCDECNFEAKLLKHLKKHQIIHRKPFQCKLCSYTSQVLKNLKIHFKQKHPSEKISYTKEREVGIKRKRSTDSESNPSPNKKIIIEFTEPDEKNIPIENLRYSCMHCSILFTDLNALKLHHIHEHWTLRNKSFCKYKIFDVTVSKRVETYLYKCKYCEFVGISSLLVEHHQENHSTMKFASESVCDYVCRFCGFLNHKLDYFRKHLRSHKVGQIAYDVLHRVSEGDAVKENVHVITNEDIISECIPTLYKCKFCKENPHDSEEKLKNHHHTFHSHLDLDINASTLHKYKCPKDNCDFQSNVLLVMKEHVRNHVKTYKCSHCSAAFSIHANLNDHLNTEHKNQEFSFTIEETPFTFNRKYKDGLLILQPNGTYNQIKNLIRGIKRSASEDLDLPENKIQIIENAIPVKKVNIAKKSTSKPPVKIYTARKSTTPVKKSQRTEEGYSFYGTKPIDFNNYKNLTTEANLQGNMVRLSVTGLQYILNLFPKVLVEDICKKP